MGQVISEEEAIRVAKKLRNDNTIVLAGGVFDILHLGHLQFLTESKKQGGVLFVLVESDKTVRKVKGSNRPINPQQVRATMVSALIPVDFAVILKEMTKDSDYDTLMAEILPNIITTTKGDPNLVHKERQAKKIGATVKFVTNRIGEFSTTRLTKLGKR